MECLSSGTVLKVGDSIRAAYTGVAALTLGIELIPGDRCPLRRPLLAPVHAPLVKPGTKAVNNLNRQRNALDTFLKACIGLEGSSDLLLEARIL
ncbi:hypothetical protein ARMSODRAFT_1019295 [Armillaria solidipes]|uniref:Uncharacterized protein n=1 Tax=Armillaria solidipes TaxID=1076256 RepID=A0A2H3BCU7_9AGAR|nr:hypothetical protein ARMSODRAFT_1019295 [Armillaria solidipes]